MNDLQILSGSGSGHGSVSRLVRASVTLFGSGFVAGLVVALVFHALITSLIIIAAVVVVVVAAARMMVRRRRD
jgi:Flp pilus assembly protein TadB